MSPSSIEAPQTEVQVHPFGVVVSGSATALGLGASRLFDSEWKGHPKNNIQYYQIVISNKKYVPINRLQLNLHS